MSAYRSVCSVYTFLALKDYISFWSKLHKKLASLDHGLTLMVTHQVVISAITKLVVGSGDLVAYNSTTFEAQALTLE